MQLLLLIKQISNIAQRDNADDKNRGGGGGRCQSIDKNKITGIHLYTTANFSNIAFWYMVMLRFP